MTQEEKSVRVQVYLPPDLAARLVSVAGGVGVSAYIRALLEKKLLAEAEDSTDLKKQG